MAKPSAKKIAADRKRLHDHYLDEVMAHIGYTSDEFKRMFGESPRLASYNGQDFSDVQ